MLDDININQWTGHVFGIEIGSRGYVAKSFGFALQKLGLKQDAITKLRKAVSLICIRCSYLIYPSRKNEIWRLWEAQHPTSKARSSSRPNFENCATEAFCGFETTQIQEAFNENQRRLDVLGREIENPNTFQGFNTQEIRTYKKINKDRTEVLKGAGHSKTGIPLVYEQVFPKTRKLVTFGSKTSTSLVNNQGSKITHGLFDFNRKTNFSSVDDHTSLKPPGLVILGNSCYMNSVMQCLNRLAPRVKFFTKDAHLEELTSPDSSGGTVANEVEAIFSAMLTGRRSPLSLMALKSKVGELCRQFSGCEQQDSREFLMYLFTWMHEELKGRVLSARESCG